MTDLCIYVEDLAAHEVHGPLATNEIAHRFAKRSRIFTYRLLSWEQVCKCPPSKRTWDSIDANSAVLDQIAQLEAMLAALKEQQG